MMKSELYHHGVLGQKWGVRHQNRVVTNYRHNAVIRDIKNKYRFGKITKDQKKSMIKSEHNKKKSDIKRFNDELKRDNSDISIYKKEVKLNQQLSKIPNGHLKVGAHKVNDILTGISAAVNASQYAWALSAASTMGIMNPVVGAALVGSLAGTTAVHAGYRYINSKIVDKVS